MNKEALKMTHEFVKQILDNGCEISQVAIEPIGDVRFSTQTAVRIQFIVHDKEELK